MALLPELPGLVADLNSWWARGDVRPKPPGYRRRGVADMISALAPKRPLIQVLRGPRQVGKTTALHQIAEELIAKGTPPTDVFLIRFDLQPVQEAGLLPLVRWYVEEVRKRDLRKGAPSIFLLDEVHRLPGWDSEIKHFYDTFPVRLVVTGSSSVLVARGQRESLAGRALTIDFPPFSFREVLESWFPKSARHLPPPVSLKDILHDRKRAVETFKSIHSQPAQRRHSWRRILERYYNRGGYPRLYSAEVEAIEDRWADYLVETVFDRVLGVDIPDLFPVDQPQLLRHIYLELARRTGTEVSQGNLAGDCNAAGFRTTQPLVGRYLHYLADALLIREFRRYPLARSQSARVPVKITLTDLGVRNAIFRGAPSLWESPPDVVGPLVETLVQSVLRGPSLQTHFYRDYPRPKDRHSPFVEVDFVVEALAGDVLPVEIKFRKNIAESDTLGLRVFRDRYKSAYGILVTRDFYECSRRDILSVPVLDFLLAF